MVATSHGGRQAQADVNAKGLSGKTPIEAACEGGFTEAVQVLLKNNAEKPQLVVGALDCLGHRPRVVQLVRPC